MAQEGWCAIKLEKSNQRVTLMETFREIIVVFISFIENLNKNISPN